MFTKLTTEERQALLDLIPASMRSRAFIAGGFVVDRDKAADIDIWVLAHELQTDLASRAAMVHSHLFRNDIDFEGQRVDSLYADSSDFAVAANLEAPVLGKPVQILVTRFANIYDLMNVFDITTHQAAIALSAEGPLTLGESLFLANTYTTPTQEPRIVYWDRPEVSLNRIHKIAPRYGFTPNPQDVMKLESLAAAKDAAFSEVPF